MGEPAPEPSAEPLWDGAWLEENLGVRLHGDGLRELVGLALRRNPRRAHLLVSHVLGKHIPVEPDRTLHAARALAGRVRDLAPGPFAVLGFAETATGLGHGVAAALNSDAYLHSTRRTVDGVRPWRVFEEEHSHATGHLLFPDAGDPLRARTVVLVDDELSTGRTVENTVRAMPAGRPAVAAALVDLRGGSGAAIPTAALARGSIVLPSDLPARAAALIERAAHRPKPGSSAPGAPVNRLAADWPPTTREGGRHGFCRADDAAARAASSRVAEQLAAERVGERVLVLGTEELMYVPTLIAAALSDVAGERAHVRVSSTTRSPVATIDEPGYAVRTALVFPAHDGPPDGPGPRYAYNVAAARDGDPYSTVVLVVDERGDSAALWAPDGLVELLRRACERVIVAVLPTSGPDRSRR